MNSKTSYTLCTPSSHKSCEKLPDSIFDSDIAKRLYLAQQKLRPVIDDVMRTATENSTVNYNTSKSHYLTVEQYGDAVLASHILRDVDKILSEKQNGMRMKKYNLNKFNLEKENVKVNKSGKIYVDTSILIQLIELHRTLGDIINNTRKAYVGADNDSNDTSSCSQTEISDASIRQDSNEGRDLSSDEKFNVTVKKSSEQSKPKIIINVVNRKSNDTKYKNTESKLSKNIIREVLPLGLYGLGESIVVMSAHSMKIDKSNEQSSMKKLSTLPEERTSNSETNLTDLEQSPRKTKSTGSIKSDRQKSKVTDVAGARKIILNCLHDLNKVRSFLERVDIGADIQINTGLLEVNSETDKVQTTDTGQSQSVVSENLERHHPEQTRRSDSRLRSSKTDKNKFMGNVNDNTQVKTHSSHALQSSKSKRDCCCDATYASDAPMELMLDGGDENASKLIICIKGKTEEEGDVQIIIRQCSECKNVGGEELIDDQITEDKSGAAGKHSDEFSSDSHVEDSHTQQDDDTKGDTTSASDQQSGINVLYDSTSPSDVKSENAKDELYTRQDQISQGDELQDTASVKSSQKIEQENAGLHVLFDPDDPAKSIVKPTSEALIKPSKKDISPEKVSHHSSLRIPKKSEQEGDGCSRIKLYETTNLCFATDDGQELVISLTIRPKSGGAAPKLSLKDIFSESTSKSDHNIETQDNIDNIFASDNEITVGIQDKQHYERFIPLSRTKICSSLEFDVSVMETKMRNKGINHINPGIVVRLKELGVNNLLRACRPVKCGRASVLNEKLRKGIPYSASLTSLPLEETDADIINQSLEMSFNKTKHSSVRSNSKTLAYFTESGNITGNITLTNKNMQISFLHISESNKFLFKNHRSWLTNNYVKKKLSYYINLVHDSQIQYKNISYKIYFFEIKKYHNAHGLQKSDTSPLLSANKCVVDNLLAKDILNPLNMEKGHKLISPKYTLKENILQSSSKQETKSAISNSSRPLANKIKPENLELKRQNCREMKKFISKIPVYKYNRKKPNIDEHEYSKSYIYDVSLQSLPRDNSGKMKDNVCCNNGHKLIPVEKLASSFLKHNEMCNKNWINKSERNQNTIEKMIYTDQESDCDKTSDDSLELYFNNFFRDKYFSKLALCQKQSSNRSLKPRKKKSEYHCSRSQSQTYFSDSTVNLGISSNPSSNQTQTSDHINNFKYETCDENLNISQSVVFHFTRLFCEYWIKNMLLKEKEDVNKKIKSVKNFSSSIDISRKEAVQLFFHNIKQKILEETVENTSRFQSQPNVEAGMDNEAGSIQFNFTPGPSSGNTSCHFKDTLISFEGVEDPLHYRPMFKRDKTNKVIGINNGIGDNSCDNFQNVIVRFESNKHESEFPKSSPESPQKGSVQREEQSVTNNRSLVPSEQIRSNIEKLNGNGWNLIDRDALHYLVYQHYFSSPSLLQRVIEKSKGLFKSNCGNSRHLVTVQNTNNKSLQSLKEKDLDTVDYCLCSKPPPAPSHNNTIGSKSLFYKKKISKLRDHAKGFLNDSECKVCGCSIKNCQSKSTGGRCTCTNIPHISKKENKVKTTSKNFLNKMSLKELKSKKSAPKKSVGMLCFPKKADISICVKLGSKTEQRPTRKCYCIKCEKRSADGSCYCSHCLGVFDKSVGKKPSNKEIATQCICHKLSDTQTVENELNRINNVSGNKQSNISNNSNISKTDESITYSGKMKEEPKQVLHTEVKAEPSIHQSENNDVKTEVLPPNGNNTEANEHNKISFNQDEIPKFLRVKKDIYSDENKDSSFHENEDVKEKIPTFLKVRKDIYSDENNEDNNLLKLEENEVPMLNVKKEFQSEETSNTDSHDANIKEEHD